MNENETKRAAVGSSMTTSAGFTWIKTEPDLWVCGILGNSDGAMAQQMSYAGKTWEE